MNTKWIAVLACGAMALGACSGSPAPAPGTTTPPPEQPANTPGDEPADPAEDTRTQPQKDFDDALTSAKTALANARARVTSAEARADAAATDAERAAAQTEIDNARDELARVVVAARALEAPDGDAARIGQALSFVDDAVEAQRAGQATLLAAEGNTGWAGRRLVGTDVASRTTVTAVRKERQDADGNDSSTLLKAEDIPPVMYAADKVMLAEGSGSSGDRLRMRGIPVVYNDRDDKLKYGNKLRIDVAGNQPNLVAGLRITGSGLVVDIGGKNADGRDFRLAGALETEITRTGTVNGYDLTLNFGKPTASPTGNAEHYWEAALMPDDEFTHASIKGGDTTLPLGTYFVRLSNHAGVNLNLEDPNDKAVSARDDTSHYLSYAAYGFMDFRGPEELGSRRAWVISRVFPFHVGYDAFADRDEMKVTNVADADKITEGKFKGRTVAAQVDVAYQNDQVYLPGAQYGARLRGDIELTATISGDADDNKISGRIMDLQLWNSRGFWDDFRDSDANVLPDVVLGEGDITDSGSFSGDIAAPNGNFGTGKYQGNFYGPLSGLEAAGTWFVEGGYYDYPLIGSFGAALVRDDGNHGVTVSASD